MSPPAFDDHERAHDFGRLLKFRPGDLDANRAGRLTPRQRLRTLLRAILYIAVGAPVLVLGTFATPSATADGPGPIVVGLLFGLLFLTLGVYIVWAALALAADALLGRVMAETGPLETAVEDRSWGRGKIHRGTVGGAQRRISPATYELIIPGRRVTAYSSPAERRILSLEPTTAHGGSVESVPAWYRTRARPLAGVVGVIAILSGANAVVVARPAATTTYEGTIVSYEEYGTRGGSRTYTLWLKEWGKSFGLLPPDRYQPANPALASKAGSRVVLYSDDGLVGPTVLAIQLGPTLYASDVYRQPETLRTYMQVAGGAMVAFGMLLAALAIRPIFAGRGRVVVGSPDDEPEDDDGAD